MSQYSLWRYGYNKVSSFLNSWFDNISSKHFMHNDKADGCVIQHRYLIECGIHNYKCHLNLFNGTSLLPMKVYPLILKNFSK